MKDVAYKTWEEALTYCETLDYAEESDWRLPNINELKTLINYSKVYPSSDFPNMQSMITLWSSTTDMGVSTTRAWSVAFSYGSVTNISKTSRTGVRCIHSIIDEDIVVDEDVVSEF